MDEAHWMVARWGDGGCRCCARSFGARSMRFGHTVWCVYRKERREKKQTNKCAIYTANHDRARDQASDRPSGQYYIYFYFTFFLSLSSVSFFSLRPYSFSFIVWSIRAQSSSSINSNSSSISPVRINLKYVAVLLLCAFFSPFRLLS